MFTPEHNKNFDSAYRPTGPRIEVKVMQTMPNVTPKPVNKPKKRWFKKTIIGILILMVFGGLWIGIKSLALSNQIFVGQKGGILKQVANAIRGSTGYLQLTGEKNGQINILLLGIGGEGHDGPYLSDTIILAQIRPNENSVSLTSIPRDYWVNVPGGIGYRKINSAFAESFAKYKDWDKAGSIATETVGKLAGVAIPYFAVIDFSGFEKAIDQVGGIDVVIDRTFTDYQYPNETNGYMAPQTFTKGPDHLNGERALIFSRSRHASGPEGSDFARSNRQHKVIQGFKEKLVSLNIVTDSATLANLLGTFSSHFHTNINIGEMLHLYQIGKDWNQENIVASSLDPETRLVCPKIQEESGAYILTVCPGKTNKDILDFFKNSFVLGKLSGEKSVVWIATSNSNNLAYRQTEQKLTSAGLTVWPITYTEVTPEETVIYQVNNKPATADFIKNILSAREVSVPPPSIKIDATRSDIIIVLGNNIKIEPTATPLPSPSVTPTPTPPVTLPQLTPTP